MPPHQEESENTKRLAAAIETFYSSIANMALSYVPIDIDLIILHKMPEVALYIAGMDDQDQSILKIFRAQGTFLSQSELDALSQRGVSRLYVKRQETPALMQYIESLILELPLQNTMQSAIIDEQKVGLLRQSAVNVIGDIFSAPTAENIDRGIKVVSTFVYTLMRDPKAYNILLSLSSHDHYTLQHSVGVATNAIILAKKIGIDDEKSLIEAGIGGLLHDIGKTRVPKEIINKKGALDESEWAIMKQHALYGYEILKDNKNIGTRAKLAVLQHHEDSNGTGYPMGLQHSQVDLFAKIVAMSDIYNAITTDRSYSKAKPPFEAFNLIKTKLAHRVDPKLFEAMVLIYGGQSS